MRLNLIHVKYSSYTERLICDWYHSDRSNSDDELMPDSLVTDELVRKSLVTDE